MHELGKLNWDRFEEISIQTCLNGFYVSVTNKVRMSACDFNPYVFKDLSELAEFLGFGRGNLIRAWGNYPTYKIEGIISPKDMVDKEFDAKVKITDKGMIIRLITDYCDEQPGLAKFHGDEN